MTFNKIGHVVWHDLFTSDRPRSISFYERIANWNFVTERARDFAWGGGEKDFVLAQSLEEAGAGFVETPSGLRDGWIPYVEVIDVDSVSAQSVRLGATIVKHPFEVPGVGRNCLLCDPLGAYVGLSLSRHRFPIPRRQFGVDFYLCTDPKILIEFYAPLFEWKTSPSTKGRVGLAMTAPTGEHVAFQLVQEAEPKHAVWVPSVKVADPGTSMSRMKARGGAPFAQCPPASGETHRTLMRDPCGTTFTLSAE